MRTGRQSRLVTAALIAPVLSFLALVLLFPLGLMIWQSVRDVEVRQALPHAVNLLSRWNPAAPLPDTAYLAVVTDLRELASTKAAIAARRLNIESPGLRTVFLAAANSAALVSEADPRKVLLDSDRGWGRPEIWLAIRAARGPFTPRFVLTALDLKQAPDGSIQPRGGDRAIYREIFVRTFSVAATVTALCFCLGLPLALYLAAVPDQLARVLLLLIMLPLWTSVLVRAMAWILLLDSNGLVNATLLATGLVSHPLALVFNRFGVIVTMTHVLIPFMVLPIYNALRNIPRHQLWAAGSLGATPWIVFSRIYLPQARSGIAAGLVLVFASGAGYYITPALVGGGSDQMLGTFVQQSAIRGNEPELAAGLGVVFLLIFLALLAGLAMVVRPKITTLRKPIRV